MMINDKKIVVFSLVMSWMYGTKLKSFLHDWKFAKDDFYLNEIS